MGRKLSTRALDPQPSTTRRPTLATGSPTLARDEIFELGDRLYIDLETCRVLLRASIWDSTSSCSPRVVLEFEPGLG